jgi:hypothetical protein
MEHAAERVSALAQLARTEYAKRARLSLVIAALLAALAAFTTWPSLRPGLFTLLAGYLATASWLFYRSRQLIGEARALRDEAVRTRNLLDWFDREDRFLSWSSTAEAIVRAGGFLILAYGFWMTTRSRSISLLLGLAYPAFSYFGSLNSARRARRKLLIEKEALASSLVDGANPPTTVQGNQDRSR